VGGDPGRSQRGRLHYGVSVGGTDLWLGAEGAKKIAVQHDLDWERFIHLFTTRVSALLRSSQPRKTPEKPCQ